MLLYRVVYAICFVVLIPWFLWSRYVKGKHHHIFQRLFPNCATPISGHGPLVWVHAVSVGEVQAVAPIVKELLRINPEWRFVVSTITHTGNAAAKKFLPEAVEYLFLPFDFRFSVRRALRIGAPTLVVFSEGDLWPVFMEEVRRVGARIAIVNGKMSDTSYSRFSRFLCCVRWLYSFVDWFCVQNALTAERLQSLGVVREKIRVTGNTKADVVISRFDDAKKKAFRDSLGLNETDRVIVCGSTHAFEETLLFDALLPIIRERPDVKIMMVPRHPERFVEVFGILGSRVPLVQKLSTYDGLTPWSVLLIDRLGILSDLYQIAEVAIVCGSFTDKVGGHNILEPMALAVPTIVGPHMYSQKALFDSAYDCGAIVRVSDASLAAHVAVLLDDAQIRSELSKKAIEWATQMRGATERTVSLLSEVVGRTQI